MKKLLTLLLVIIFASIAHAQESQDQSAVEDPAAPALKQLSSRDPLVRQHGAEELARLEATDRRRIVEGYRLQEKNARVKLALDWALYRFGKTEALFAVVRDLDSSRFRQAFSYLTLLETPDPLYLFLERVNGNTQIKLLQVLAKIGNAETIERIKPYLESFDPLIVEAAQETQKEIERRQEEKPLEKPTRPRQAEQNSSP
ncbi:MAG TPA: hypothetical protein VF791_23000 [Pyrinomonadaceae bacterium]